MPWAELTDARCYYEVDGAGQALLMIDNELSQRAAVGDSQATK